MPHQRPERRSVPAALRVDAASLTGRIWWRERAFSTYAAMRPLVVGKIEVQH
jgi:hypothetical protein